MLRRVMFLRQVLALLLVCLSAAPALAHQLRPSLAEISFSEDGARWRIVFNQMNLEAIIADIGPEHDNTDDSIKRPIYESYRAMPSGQFRGVVDRFTQDFLNGLNVMAGETRLAAELENVIIPPVGDLALSRDSVVTVGGPLPRGADALTFSWNPRFGDVVLRTVETGEGSYTGFLTGGAASESIPVTGILAQSALEAFAEYVIVGFEHILPKGLDHILFVMGLFLLSTRMRPLLIQITSFTFAHTITLALGILGYITIPASIVEPLIAASIVYVAVENILTDKLSSVRPTLVIFFGLLHGLGFAGVLAEFGLAPGQFAASLIAFNVGVEIGQLTVIALCFAAVGWLGARDWYHDQITIPLSLAIAATAIAWTIERAADIDLGPAGRAVFFIALIVGVWSALRRPGLLGMAAQLALAGGALALFYYIDRVLLG